ncbi:MAG: PIN domain-containing protein [Synechococcales bacterium]|nr:PIN domain-containing protein [Synechococcales bacterium]
MGQLSIADGAIVYLDTAPIIYSIERNPDYWQLLIPLWQKLQAGTIQLISSELLLLECLVIPIRTNNTVLINAYEQFLATRIILFPVSETILRTATQLRAINNLKTPDAIHAATALNNTHTVFLTNDTGLRNVSGLSVTILKDVLNT